MTFIERRCLACGTGTIQLTPTDTWKTATQTISLPDGFELPTCDSCGEIWLNVAYAAALDRVLKLQKKASENVNED